MSWTKGSNVKYLQEADFFIAFLEWLDNSPENSDWIFLKCLYVCILPLTVFSWYCLFVILAQWVPPGIGLGIHNLAAPCIFSTDVYSNIVVLIHSIHPGYWLSSTLSLRLLTFQITCHSNKVKPIFFKVWNQYKIFYLCFFCFLVPLIFHNRWSLCEHCLLLWCSLHLMAWCAFNDPLMIIMTIIYLMTCKFISKGQALRNLSMFYIHKIQSLEYFFLAPFLCIFCL